LGSFLQVAFYASLFVSRLSYLISLLSSLISILASLWWQRLREKGEERGERREK